MINGASSSWLQILCHFSFDLAEDCACLLLDHVVVVLVLDLLLERVVKPERFPAEGEIELIAIVNPALRYHWDSTIK
jgi:hypothetical protein